MVTVIGGNRAGRVIAAGDGSPSDGPAGARGDVLGAIIAERRGGRVDSRSSGVDRSRSGDGQAGQG